jgi:hypothetical protein
VLTANHRIFVLLVELAEIEHENPEREHFSSDLITRMKVIRGFQYCMRAMSPSQKLVMCKIVLLDFFFFFHWLLQSSFRNSPPIFFGFPNLFRHMVRLLERVVSSSQGLYLHRATHHRKTKTNIHVLSGIRTRDPVYKRSSPVPQTARGHWIGSFGLNIV